MEQDLAIHIRDVTLAFTHAHLVSLIARCFFKDVLRILQYFSLVSALNFIKS